MRPHAMANANATVGVGGNGVGANSNASANSSSNGVNIPINHEYGHQPPPQQQPGYYGDANNTAYGSPRQQQQQQIPAHFQQGFNFDPDMDIDRDLDMDMFPRSRLGRMHDPFSTFGSSHFGFPQFNTMGRRRANDAHDDDFFQRLPSQFRQYIPETFGHRRSNSSQQPQQQSPQTSNQGSQYFHYPSSASNASMNPNPVIPPSPTKKVCDAAIQTEDPATDAVDGCPLPRGDNLQQHGLRNTVDMGIKSALESDAHGARSHSAPPNEQPQPSQQQQQQPQPQQQAPMNGRRQTPPPQATQAQFGTQTSPHVQVGAGQQPPFQKVYYAPQSQPHPQQQRSQQAGSPPPPQTPGGTYVRTIPIFVEGRDEPIINSHKEIPVQSGAPNATASARAHVPHQPNQQQQHYYPQPQAQQQYQQQPPHPQQQHQQPRQQHQQQHRPTPLNTQQQYQPQAPPQRTAAGEQQQQRQQPGPGAPPQTPHTLDSINKIQDIQRDVLDLMAQVEKFTGTRKDKNYAYLDEMLTRNLLKLDTIDTQGKESIRQARKEAIKCIQASINVLEAKAEENARKSSGDQARPIAASSNVSEETGQMSSGEEPATTSASEIGNNASELTTAEPSVKSHEPIPLPPPEGMQVEDGTQVSQCQSEASGGENAISNASQTNTEASAMDTANAQTEGTNAEGNEANANGSHYTSPQTSADVSANASAMDVK